MEESKELQGLYTLFRVAIYVSLVLEFFMYALDPSALDFLGGLITDIHSRLHRMSVYQYLPFSKLVTVMLVIITCIGTKNKKQLEFDARKMVFWPISIGLLLVTPASNGEARRLVVQGGVLADGEKVAAHTVSFIAEQLAQGIVITKGKKIYHKVTL
mgnify:CR=1 FL=1